MSELGFAVFNTGVNIFETFLHVWFATRYLGYQEKVNHRKRDFGITWLVLFAQLQIVNSVTMFEGMLIFLNPVILCVYVAFVLQGRKLEKLFVSIIPLMCTALINSFVAGLQTIIWKEHMNNLIFARSYKYIVMLIVTKVLLVVVLLAILKVKQKVKELPENRLWFLFVIILVTSIVSVFFIYLTLIGGCKEVQYLYYLVVSIVGIVIMNIVTFYFLRRIGKETELRQKIELLQQNALYQQENVKSILQEQERAKQIRHDMKNVIYAIQGLAKKEESDKITDYCTKYIGEIGPDNNAIYTGIDTIDNLLAYKFTIAENRGNLVKTEIAEIDLKNINDIHICIILGNLLDNAIEALQKVNIENKILEIIIEQEQESYINIFVKNTVEAPILEKNPDLFTTKMEKEIHGFGVRNVKELVKQYEGIINFYDDENMFVCHIEI